MLPELSPAARAAAVEEQRRRWRWAGSVCSERASACCILLQSVLVSNTGIVR